MSDKCPETGEKCSTKYSVYEDRRHVLLCSSNDKILGTPAEFCKAFYHVSEKGQQQFCLGRYCTSGEPKTAVAFVRYDDGNDELVCLKRYTNCYSCKMHAEEFFSRDINRSLSRDVDLVKAIYDDKKIKKITMFITMQPCHRSTIGTQGTYDDQSCCRIIVEALVGLPRDVKISIKPTHLMKVGWKKKDNPTSNLCIDNAKIGIKALMCISRVSVSAMEFNDWQFLWDYVDSPPRITSNLTERTDLDKNIKKVLEKLKRDVDSENPHPVYNMDDDDELIFKALCEMSEERCNNNSKIPDIDLNDALDNLNLTVEIDNLWSVMKYVKRHFGYLGDKNCKEQSEYRFVFIKKNVEISWDKNSNNLKKEKIGNGGLSGSGSKGASGGTSGETDGETDGEIRGETSEGTSGSTSGRISREASGGASGGLNREADEEDKKKKRKEKNKYKAKNKSNDIKG